MRKSSIITSIVMTIALIMGCTPKVELTPKMTVLTPDALTWKATSTTAKTILVAGDNLVDAEITLSELSKFTANIEGSTITVAPNAANSTQSEIVENLTVTVAGGNQLTATLTQEAYIPNMESLSPSSLTWEGNETVAKTIVISGINLEGATITAADMADFTASISGTTITVTPKGENLGADPKVNTLTVTAAGGNSLTATLTQKANMPELKTLTPAALSWGSKETDAKTITVDGLNLDGKTITVSAPAAFTATISGTTITVAPKAANTGDAEIVNELTVSVEGGNSLTATLTHEKPIRGWVKVTENRDDWSGKYLFLSEWQIGQGTQANLIKFWYATAGNQNRGFILPDDFDAEGFLFAGRTTNKAANAPDISLEGLNKYVITITKTEGGYYLQTAEGKYICNRTNAAGIEFIDSPMIGATSITMEDDILSPHLKNSLKIVNTTVDGSPKRFGFINQNNKFDYFLEANWSDDTQKTRLNQITILELRAK